MNPLVSVVITTYNQGAFIGETLKSALAQSYAPYEVIVVDDGSTDDTPQRVAPFADRITYLRQENRGVAGARNTGIGATRGEYLAFLDGDDLWEPGKLAAQVEAALAHPDSGLIVTDGSEFDDRGTISPSLFFEPCCRQLPEGSVTSGWFYRQLLEANFIATTSQVMVPARVLERVGFSDGEFAGASDYDLYLRIAAQFPITLVRKRLTRWRYRANSVSGPRARRSFRYLPEDVAVLKKQLERSRGEERDLLREAVKKRLADGTVRLYYYGTEKEKRFAAGVLLKLWTKNPSCIGIPVYLARLACPEPVRNRFGKLIRTMLSLTQP